MGSVVWFGAVVIPCGFGCVCWIVIDGDSGDGPVLGVGISASGTWIGRNESIYAVKYLDVSGWADV